MGCIYFKHSLSLSLYIYIYIGCPSKIDIISHTNNFVKSYFVDNLRFSQNALKHSKIFIQWKRAVRAYLNENLPV